ncbi:PLP-dependent transferase, partial [Bacillus altitudinis]|uniref:PLP-dependent transferase n=1 Tax=Bacillus altitudinis TaxID=293387 RepID=UPI003B52CE5B
MLRPQHAWLLIPRMKTLGLTIQAHQQNPHKIPHFLQHHPPITPLYYPPLTPHPPHHFPKTQPTPFPPIISFHIPKQQNLH